MLLPGLLAGRQTLGKAAQCLYQTKTWQNMKISTLTLTGTMTVHEQLFHTSTTSVYQNSSNQNNNSRCSNNKNINNNNNNRQ